MVKNLRIVLRIRGKNTSIVEGCRDSLCQGLVIMLCFDTINNHNSFMQLFRAIL